MSIRRAWRSGVCWTACLALVVQAFAGSGYHLVKRIPIESVNENWGYITIDQAGDRLFVTHETQVEVVHVNSGELLGSIPASGARAVALAPEFKHGFVTNAQNATVTMFDFDTLKKLTDIPAGDSPDFITYDAFTKRVFSFNSGGGNSTVINAATGSPVETINLDGKTGGSVADGVGHVFVDIKDKGVVARIDSRKLVVDQRWPIADCEQPSSLDIDKKTHRLFIGCANMTLYVMSSDNGRVIAQLPIGENADSTTFDPATGLIFTSSGDDGIISIEREDGPNSYRAVDAIYTKIGSKTMALDYKTHQLFLPSGDLEKLPPAAPGGQARKKVVANTFAILVAGK